MKIYKNLLTTFFPLTSYICHEVDSLSYNTGPVFSNDKTAQQIVLRVSTLNSLNLMRNFTRATQILIMSLTCLLTCKPRLLYNFKTLVLGNQKKKKLYIDENENAFVSKSGISWIECISAILHVWHRNPNDVVLWHRFLSHGCNYILN